MGKSTYMVIDYTSLAVAVTVIALKTNALLYFYSVI